MALVGLVAATTACDLLRDSGFIVYESGPEGSRDIALVRPDGSQRLLVVEGASDDFAPLWSPDNTRIAFLSDRDGNVEAYVAVANGSNAMRATNTVVAESDLAWSPDGQNLVYVSPDAEGRPHIFWLRLTDLIPNRLTLGVEAEAEMDPAWSPDGKWIAYVGLDEKGNSLGIFLRNPRGVDRIHVDNSSAWSPAWSPDGKRLAYVSEWDGNQEVYVINVGDGRRVGEPVRITRNPTPDYAPVWSPDGGHIAFVTVQRGKTDIATVTSEGKESQVLTTNEVDERSPVWGPDGRLVFVSEAGGRPGVFIMEADGSGQRQITADGTPNDQPDW